MAKVIVAPNVSAADTKRIQASGFEDEAKNLRNKVKRQNGGTASVFREVALYLDSRAALLRMEADTLDLM